MNNDTVQIMAALESVKNGHGVVISKVHGSMEIVKDLAHDMDLDINIHGRTDPPNYWAVTKKRSTLHLNSFKKPEDKPILCVISNKEENTKQG